MKEWFEETSASGEELLLPSVLQDSLPPQAVPGVSQFARDIAAGLSADQKFIPSKYLYDRVGSALFEAITCLREYRCTEGEMRLLNHHAEELLALLPPQPLVAELGGGSGAKAEIILARMLASYSQVEFHNIDISPAALQASRHTLAELSGVRFHGHASDFVDGLAHVARVRTGQQPVLVLFLGSSIGNFSRDDAASFLCALRRQLQPDDFLLLGTDLVKPAARLLQAYDDPQGVTAAFNKNLLARINHELQADFNLRQFQHQARWNPAEQRIEMHLVSTRKQTVTIHGAAIHASFCKGESIHTENSHKYKPAQVVQMAQQCGFQLRRQWLDEPSLFAANLLAAV